MIPKSTAKIKEGDYCLIQRDDGRYVPFVYLFKQGASRNYFYGGIANTVLESDNSEDIPNGIDVTDYALLHIKCFKENNTPIVGNLMDKLKKNTFTTITSDVSNASVGSKSSVWGYKTIFKYANKVNA